MLHNRALKERQDGVTTNKKLSCNKTECTTTNNDHNKNASEQTLK